MIATLSRPINVLVVDDHPIVRNGITGIAKRIDTVGYCDQAENGLVALEKIRNENFDIVFLDLGMPVMDGVTTMRHIRSEYPSLNVIVLTMFENRLQCIEMLELGVKGYLLKDTDEAEISRAMNLILEGGQYLTSSVHKTWTEYLTQKQENLPQKTSVSFTGRELQVLNLICQQYSLKEIAEQLFLSEATVNNHRSHLMSKTGIHSSVGLAVFAMQHGYYTPYK